MNSIINRKEKKINSIKNKNYNRRSSLNLDFNSKISNIKDVKEVPSIFKMNKTIQKYVNEKLRLLNGNIQPNKTSKELLRNINNIKTKKNYSFNKIIRNKSIHENKTKKIKGRNYRHDHPLFSNEFKTSYVNANYRFNDSTTKILNKSKIKGKENLKKKINEKINILIKNPDNKLTTKGKLVNDFYQNYLSSMSMSTGISLNHNNEIIYKEGNKDIIKDNNTINSKNNYEIDSIEEDNIHEIIFKGINKGSPITFGNSFSYTNSKRSSNSNKEEKEEVQEKIDKSVLLLKCQNETLKKELKESNQQISILKKEIERLIKKRKMNITSYKYNVDIKNKKQESKPKIFSKNSSYLDNICYDIDKSHYNNDIKITKKFSNKSCYNKMKILNKNKMKMRYENKKE